MAVARIVLHKRNSQQVQRGHHLPRLAVLKKL